jgi:hypothetical protein
MLQHRTTTGLYRKESKKNMRRPRREWNGHIDKTSVVIFWFNLCEMLYMYNYKKFRTQMVRIPMYPKYLMLLLGLLGMVAQFEDSLINNGCSTHMNTNSCDTNFMTNYSHPDHFPLVQQSAYQFYLDQCGDIHPHPGPAIVHKGIKCLSLNAQSIKKLDRTTDKLLEFKTMTDIMDPDIFTITETWLNDNIGDKDITDKEKYNIYRKDRTHTNGGGVLCLIKKDIWSTRRKDLEATALRHNEIIATEIRPKAGERLILLSAYRSQMDPCKDFLENLERTLINASNDDIFDFIILGDLNYRQIKWTENEREQRLLPPHCRNLLSLMTRWNMRQLNYNPSRKDGKSILDLVITNLANSFSKVDSQTYEYQSDHFLLEFTIDIENTRKEPITRTVYNFRRANLARIKAELGGIRLPDTNNVNQIWNQLKRKIITILDRNIPRVKIRNKTNPPWIDHDVIQASKSKDTKYKKAKLSENKDDWDVYKTARNGLKNLVNRKYKDYIRHLGSDLTDNPKKFWSLLKSRTKSKGSPERIIVDNIEYSDPVGMANVINKYLCSIFQRWGENPIPEVQSIVNHGLSSLILTESEVRVALTKLNPNKAPGPDGIPTKVLKDFATELAPHLTRLYNTSLSTGKLPLEWKEANIVVIHKKGKKTDPSNYRPISLLPVCSKVLERCIYNNIIAEIRPLISNSQHGFLANSSTSTQLLTFFNTITNMADNKDDIDLVYFDLSKAFDSVPHPPVLRKLTTFGVNGILLKWFTDYLTDRKQRVVLDGKSSGWLPVTSGVPQGSILGPLLFLLYINDLPENLHDSTICGIFADDTKIARRIRTHNDNIQLQHDIDSLSNWGDKWGLCFNAIKCKHLNVSQNPVPTNHPYTLNDQKLETVADIVDLGVTVSNDLKWSKHIQQLCKKAEGRLWLVIRTIGFYSPVIAKKTAYIAMIRSILEYCSPVWNPRYKNLQKTLEDIQRKATNFILNNPRYDHPDHINYKNRLLILNLLPTSYRREIHDVILLLKSLNGPTNLDLTESLKFYERRGGPLTRQGTLGTRLEIAKPRLERTHHFYTHRIVDTWNTIPDAIRQAIKSTDNSLIIKQHLLPYYREKLVTDFDPYNQCTWTSI